MKENEKNEVLWFPGRGTWSLKKEQEGVWVCSIAGKVPTKERKGRIVLDIFVNYLKGLYALLVMERAILTTYNVNYQFTNDL